MRLTEERLGTLCEFQADSVVIMQAHVDMYFLYPTVLAFVSSFALVVGSQVFSSGVCRTMR